MRAKRIYNVERSILKKTARPSAEGEQNKHKLKIANMNFIE